MRAFRTTARASYRALFFLLILAGPATADEGSPAFSSEQITFFETEIRPLLADNCLECHTGTKAKTGLQLNHRRGWLKGSDYRPVVDISNPSESLVIHAVSHTPDKQVKPMPYQGEKISQVAVEKLTQWIAMGLPWTESPDEVPDDPSRHWSFQPVAPPALPADAGNPIDHLLAAARATAGVAPAPRADRATLFRRAHFTLTGLPPDYEEQRKFVADPRPDPVVWSELIDRLLASPAYGERWARHWMDVARYSDTKGYEANARERRFIYSYTYRDWLIRAFNEDLPYDQFLLYQLAGEQLVDWEGPERHHLAALGFLSLSKNDQSQIIIDDRIDTTFRGTMALTVACARCHDHKFDPIPTKEYYSLYSIFSNSFDMQTPVIGEPPSGPAYDKYLAELAEHEKKIEDFLAPKLERLKEEFPELANRRDQLLGKLNRDERRDLQNIEKVRDKFIADSKMEPDKAIVLVDKEKPAGHAVFIRGDPARRGDPVERHFPTLGQDVEPVVYQEGSGRLGMARDIASAKNPLTARNIVNRVWMWHFGEGIVRTVDDFGILGDRPVHPELLDFLSQWFVENGWSIKKLQRLLMESETWQQSAQNPASEQNLLADPENRLLWRHDLRRLELEQMRDAMLAVSGELDRTVYGRSVKILEPPYSKRRSVYAFIDRQNLNPVFRNFDFSNPQETTAKRPSTTIPMQALFTLNSDFVQDRAAVLGKQAATHEDGIGHLHRTVLGSEPSEGDRILAESFLESFESEVAALGPRQTNTEWSYGYGSVDPETGNVTFTPFPHWTGDAWQIGKDRPLKDNPLSYLYAQEGATHPGYTAKESAIYRWLAPADVTVAVNGIVERPNQGQGNGVRVQIVSEKGGILFDQVLDPSRKTLPAEIEGVSLAKNESLYFLVDPHENNSSFDSVRWSPQVVDLSGNLPKSGLAETFSGPATPATAWGAYAQALLNTNRFLFLQ